MIRMVVLVQFLVLFFCFGNVYAGFIGTFNPVPEPSTSLLVIAGIIAGAGVARRNKRK